jgi:predicted amidohydrolase
MKDKNLTIGALQLSTLPMNITVLHSHIRDAHKSGCKILLFGEYIINHFFKELTKTPKEMVKEQTEYKVETLKELAKKYNMVFVVPIVEVNKDKYYKKMVKISPKSTTYYTQQILMNYPHWNEERFFSNPIDKLKEPLIFKINGFKVAAIFGFEIHFDKFWHYIQQRAIDLVLIPTANTFNSQSRWRNLISSRAFISNCYILRANRVGHFVDEVDELEIKWNFYGDSFLVDPNGNILNSIDEKRSLLVTEINKDVLRESRVGWKFRMQLKKRGEL